MTPERKDMINYTRFEQPVKIKLADDAVLNSYGKGDITLTVFNDGEKVNVLLKGKSCKVTIEEKKYVIGRKHGKLYKLNTAADETCCVGQAHHEEPLLLWHQRYGHLGYDNLKALNDKSMVKGLSVNTRRISIESAKGCLLYTSPSPRDS